MAVSTPLLVAYRRSDGLTTWLSFLFALVVLCLMGPVDSFSATSSDASSSPSLYAGFDLGYVNGF